MYRRILLLAAAACCLFTVIAPAAAQDECPPDFRLFEHEMLITEPVCVPEHPQRIAPLDMTIIEFLLIVDHPPVIASSLVMNAYARMLPALEPNYTALLESAQDVGYPPNIEAVLDAQPDLIIAPSDFLSESLYPELSAIAPTLLYEAAPGDWRSRLRFAGEVFGMSETVDELLADYDARVTELRDALPETEVPLTVSLVRTFPDQIGLVVSGTTAAAILQEAGLARPEAQAVDYDYVLGQLDGRPEILISAEELQLADADVIFVFGDPSKLVENPLWNTLSAVQNGRAYEVGYHWWADTLIAAHAMLDDLFEYVAQVEPEHANPFAAGILLEAAATPEASS